MAKTNTQGNLHQNVTENDKKRQESADSTVESQGRLNFDPNSVTGGSASQEAAQQGQAQQEQAQQKASAAEEKAKRLAEAKAKEVSGSHLTMADIDRLLEDPDVEGGAASLAERDANTAAMEEAERIAGES